MKRSVVYRDGLWDIYPLQGMKHTYFVYIYVLLITLCQRNRKTDVEILFSTFLVLCLLENIRDLIMKEKRILLKQR